MPQVQPRLMTARTQREICNNLLDIHQVLLQALLSDWTSHSGLFADKS